MQMHVVEPHFNPGDPLGLCDSLVGKMGALREFLNSTATLKEAFESDNADAIDALIEEREMCINRINVIDGYIRKISTESPSYYHRLSTNRKEKISEIAGLIEEVLDQMRELNKECIASATQRIKMVQLEISKNVSNRRPGRGAYETLKPARFVDITS